MTNQAELYKKINKGQLENGDALLKYAAPKSGEMVLDIGCGTGELTYRLAESIGANGKVIAVDPDNERMQLAQESQPKELHNITWINDYFTSEVIAPKPTFDLIFSNFVLHWIKGDDSKKAAIKLLFDCLKKGGRFAIQFVYGLTEIQTLVSEFANRPTNFESHLHHFWLDAFKKSGLTYEIKKDMTPYYHSDLDDFLAWYEGTTHGDVKRSAFSESQMEILRKKYPGEIYVDHLTLRLVGYK